MRIKNLLGASAVAVLMLMSGQTAFAASKTCPSGTIRVGKTVNSLAECNIEKDDSLIPTIQVIINVILGVLGLVSVVFIILGGITYVTSSGDPGKIKKAKDTILYGIIGLVVALLAYAIVNFVLSSVFGNVPSSSGGSGGSGGSSGP